MQNTLADESNSPLISRFSLHGPQSPPTSESPFSILPHPPQTGGHCWGGDTGISPMMRPALGNPKSPFLCQVLQQRRRVSGMEPLMEEEEEG